MTAATTEALAWWIDAAQRAPNSAVALRLTERAAAARAELDRRAAIKGAA